MNETRLVAALCVGKNSPYHSMPNIDCYDRSRNAYSFPGGCPIIAHPPCRGWSAFLAHQAKCEPGELELGLYCCSLLRLHGGILEQPAHSRLMAAGGLPPPGDPYDGRVVTIRVNQAWWGTPVRKATWLAIAGQPATSLDFPFALLPPGDKARWRKTAGSTGARAGTTPAFAEWLAALARRC